MTATTQADIPAASPDAASDTSDDEQTPIKGEPVALTVVISELSDVVDSESDRKCIGRIRENLSKLHTKREKHLQDSHSLLRALSRQYAVAKQSCHETETALRERDHSDHMSELDHTKFAIAKNVNDLESNAHSLEGQLKRLRHELDQLESEDLLQKEAESEDGVVLKLKVYRGLGIDLEEDGSGGYKKVAIRNAKMGDVHVINIDKRSTPFEYANFFWDHI